MERKSLVAVAGISVLACFVVMLAVIGGLYAYNTFVAEDAPVVHAAGGTDTGKTWSVTPVVIQGNQEYLVVMSEADNPYEKGETARMMAVYELRSSGQAKGDLYLVATRLIEYDFGIPDLTGKSTSKGYSPLDVKKATEKKR